MKYPLLNVICVALMLHTRCSTLTVDETASQKVHKPQMPSDIFHAFDVKCRMNRVD